MVNRNCHMPAVYSAGPKAEKPREPWGQDCGSGPVPQFGGDTQDFTGTVVPCLTSYLLASFERTRPVTEAIGAGPLYHKTAGASPLTKVQGFPCLRYAATEIFMNLEESLNDLSSVLRRLHKALLEAEAENFGPISGPFQLLNLVTYHQHFAWLHSLSELMVDLDELREDIKPVDADQAAVLRTTIERLVGPRAPSQPQFRERYVTLLQQSSMAAMVHGDLRRVLDKFPESSSDEIHA
jgi:hypothetical protein